MPRPSIDYIYKYKTSTQVCDILGISSQQLLDRLKRGVLPEPTLVTETGTRYFDDTWLREAKIIIANGPGRQTVKANVKQSRKS